MPYTGIAIDQWIAQDGYRIYYASTKMLSWSGLLSLIREADADVLYLNSMFSPRFALYPMLMKRLGLIHHLVFISPRGMLKPSALQHKAFKKAFFLRVFKLSGAYKDVHFLSTDKQEGADIVQAFGPETICFTTGNLPAAIPDYTPPPSKYPGELKMIFVGRIHPIKNLDYLLECMIGLRGKVILTVVATLEDMAYWSHCLEIIRKLDPEKQVVLKQDLPHSAITSVLQEHHLFVLPTKGENFGHAIYEALAAGRPVLISDQTPWRKLRERKSGWDLPLSNPGSFSSVLQEVINMQDSILEEWCISARKLAIDSQQNNQIKKMYIKLFSTQN
jgi:glycosyltransferase involved in cell wall biosynthesis